MNVQLFIYANSAVELVIAIGYIDNIIGASLLVIWRIASDFRGVNV